MITAIDTNVLIALWDERDTLNLMAQDALDRAYNNGSLIICGAVFAELVAGKNRTSEMVEGFLDDTDIRVDWTIDEIIWRSAAKAFQDYAGRRRKQRQHEPKRLVTDFIVGGHAYQRGYSLLTFDNRIFKAAFPQLNIFND